jgi:HK97 family phage prohead protease
MKPKKFFASVPEVKKIDVDKRTVEHVISTGSEDRDGDTINPKGWILDEFLKNPVVLFGHRHDMPPIARAVKLKASENGLEALTQFPPKGISQLADTVFEMNRLGYLRSWSVGFDPEKFTMRENGGMDFEEQKLLEYSSVPVPANPEAVNLAVSKGIMTDKMLELFEWQKEALLTEKDWLTFKNGNDNYVPLEVQIMDGTAIHGPCGKSENDGCRCGEPPPDKLDISPEKLQSCFDNGIAALQISGADHARILRPGRTSRA